MKNIIATYLGITDYKDIWNLQKQLFEMRYENKIPDILLLNQHESVYTIGKGGDDRHLLSNHEKLNDTRIPVYNIDRGGDITYHGPGQIVGYPIFDLKNYYLDIHRFLRDLEETIILTLQTFGINSVRDDGFTGVWVDNNKIAALGVKVSRWITMHGFALTVNTDLSYFDKIIPCGIFHKGITSMKQILGHEIEIEKVNEIIYKNISLVFNKEVLVKDKKEFSKIMEKNILKKEKICQEKI